MSRFSHQHLLRRISRTAYVDPDFDGFYSEMFDRKKCVIIVEFSDHHTNSTCYEQDLKMHIT